MIASTKNEIEAFGSVSNSIPNDEAETEAVAEPEVRLCGMGQIRVEFVVWPRARQTKPSTD